MHNLIYFSIDSITIVEFILNQETQRTLSCRKEVLSLDKKELFQIGDVAKMFHLSVSSLRHYERLGILTPEYTDPHTGYRYYSTRQFECLNTIRYLRLLDTPLDQIGAFLKNREIGHIQELLYQQKAAVAAKRRELEVVERKITHRLKQLEDALSSQLDEIRLTAAPSRRIVRIRSALSIGSDFDLEPFIRQLEEKQTDAMIFLGKIGIGITKERLLQKQYDQYGIVFLLLDPEDDYTGQIEELPPEICVTVRFRGSHPEAAAQYERLDAFLAEHQLEITGFSREITMIDYGLTCDTQKFVTEIQIPIQPMEQKNAVSSITKSL